VGDFADDFIRALSLGVAGAWRERWWVVDLLLIDGAEELEETERAQEELFHLMEALGRRRARMMVAADRPPSQIRALDDRLRGWLERGLVVEVEVAKADLPSDVRETAEAETSPQEPKDEKKVDVAAEDLEWIKTFRPKAVDPDAASGKQVGGSDALAAEALEAEGREPWDPSPELVILHWPTVEDRIVEVED
jgi:hypothetical protein